MKKKLLPASILLLSLGMSAQSINLSVDDRATLDVNEGALLYVGGGAQTKGIGTTTINGNMMIVGSGSDAFRTLSQDGTADKTDGGNIRLVINDPTNASPVNYGQLYISGLSQANITAVVDKEYKAPLHGSFQQMGLPFANKTVASLATELGRGSNFVNARNTSALGFWDNINTVMRVANPAGNTVQYGPTTYFAVGTNGWSPTTLKTLKGQAFADGADVIVTLENGGKPGGTPINYGAAGEQRNEFNETYRSYIIDPFSTPAWSSGYGKELYQLGNPFLTNIDLSKIGTESLTIEGSTTDLNKLPVVGVRYNVSNVAFTQGVGTSTGTNNLVVTFAATGEKTVATGDVNDMIIKPLGSFYIKLDPTLVGTNSYTRILNFNNLRRFNNTARANGTAYNVSAARNNTTSTIKQLGVIGLNSQGQEVGRSYYVVYANGTTGFSSLNNTQANTGFTGTVNAPIALPLYTKEESPSGGIDPSYDAIYNLYINEANETEYKHKEIPLRVNSPSITQFKFEIRENAELVPNNQSVLSGGEAFWIKLNGQNIQVSNNMTLPAQGVSSAGLYYGAPQTTALGTADTNVYTGTIVAYQQATNDYVVLFSKKWTQADIQIFDMSGRLYDSAKGLDTKKSYTLNIPKDAKAGYVVKIISSTGETVTTKIMR